MLSDDYEQEQEKPREKLLRLNEEISEQEEQSENIDRFISKVQKYLDLDELTPSVLNDMVKAVYVHAPDKSKGHREQQIDISYDLVGILPASLLNELQNKRNGIARKLRRFPKTFLILSYECRPNSHLFSILYSSNTRVLSPPAFPQLSEVSPSVQSSPSNYCTSHLLESPLPPSVPAIYDHTLLYFLFRLN